MFRKKKDQKAKAPELFEEDARAAEINPESHHTKTAEPVEEEKPKRREDKIFGNSFNLGNVEHENFHEVRIEDQYANTYLDDCYATEDYYQKQKMLDEVMQVFDKSQWREMPLGKRFPKEVLPYIFQELYLGLQGKGYTTVDMFIAITEFMDLPYEKVYEATGVTVKEQLIQELETKYGVLAKKKINRLF